MRLLFAFLCAASAFPAMLATSKERWPDKSDPAKIAWDPKRSWYHNVKNEWSETLRADCEWWGKFLAFVIVVLAVSFCVQLIVH